MIGEEDDAARRLLADLLLTTPDDLPPEVDQRIRSFKLIDFNLEDATRAFLADPPMKKRRLLELVVKMVDADGHTDLVEDQFIRELARHLGMREDEYQDLVLEIEVEELPQRRRRRMRESFRELAAVTSDPPPIPEDARKV